MHHHQAFSIIPHLNFALRTCQSKYGYTSGPGNDIIKGFKFEDAICRELSELNVSYVGEDVNTSPSVCTFKISLNLQQIHLPLTNMVKGILYFLRVKHPVIDAVGVFADNAEQRDWLVMLQISLSSYQQHRSKSQNLHDKVKGPESTVCPGSSWLEYYKKLADKAIAPATPTPANSDSTETEACLRAIYVYISPANFNDSPEILKDCGVKARNNFFLGLIVKDSNTHNLIRKTLATLQY